MEDYQKSRVCFVELMGGKLEGRKTIHGQGGKGKQKLDNNAKTDGWPQKLVEGDACKRE